MAERIKADLHNHLARFGTFTSFNNVIDIASGNLGEEGVFAIANCQDRRYERFVGSPGYEKVKVGDIGIYVPEKRVLVLKAQEVETKSGDLLVLCAEGEDIKWHKTLEDSAKESQDKGGIGIAVHPFYKGGIGHALRENTKLLEYLAAIEVFNAQAELWLPFLTPRNANRQAREFYEEVRRDYDLGMCAFTDGHNEKLIGRSYTLIPQVIVETSGDVRSSLDAGIREVEDDSCLAMVPNKLGALKHAFELVVWNKLFPIKHES